MGTPLLRNLAVTALGATSVVVVAAANVFTTRRWGIDFFLFAIWFIPLGPIALGAAATTGFVSGARLFQQKASNLIFTQIHLAAIWALILSHWIAYRLPHADGASPFAQITFLQYLRYYYLSLRLSNWVDVVGVGSFGYIVLAVQVLGLSIGAHWTCTRLRAATLCRSCGSYLASKDKSSATFALTDDDARQYTEVQVLARDDVMYQAVKRLLDDTPGCKLVKLSRTAMSCPVCGIDHTLVNASLLVNGKWKRAGALDLLSVTETPSHATHATL